MGQIKKNKGEPSQSFKNRIVSLSCASTWEECRKEWKFANYYYIPDTYKSCICSPRSIKNAVLLVNEETQAEVLLCNSCAEDYFGIKIGGIIENSVRRLLKDSKKNSMDMECIDYLDDYNILNVREIENYEVGLKCRTDEWVMSYKKAINHKLIVFTNYKYRDIFNKIDCLLVEFVKAGDEGNIELLAYMRQYFLNINAKEVFCLEQLAKLNSLIDSYNIDINNCTIYSYKEKKLAHKSIQRYVRSSLNDWLHLSKYFEKKIKSGQATILPHHAEYEPGFDKESYLPNKKKSLTMPILNLEGLEDVYPIDDYDEKYRNEYNEVDLDFSLYDEDVDKKVRALLVKYMKKVTPKYTALDLLEDIEGESNVINQVPQDCTIENCVEFLIEYGLSVKYTELTIRRLYKRMDSMEGAKFIKSINRVFSKAKIELKVKGDNFKFYNK